MKTALIFGINGFVGKYLADEFVAHGYQVLGTDRTEKCSLSAVSWYQQADLIDADAVNRILWELQPDYIVNLAAISSVGQSWTIPQVTMQVNIIGLLNILEALKKVEKATKLLLIGSSEEYAVSDKPLNEESPLCPTSPYGASKSVQAHLADMYTERYGMQIYRVRAFNHTGIGQSDTFVLPSFCKQIARIERSRRPGIVRTGNLQVVRDFSDVRDIVRAYRMVIESSCSGEVFNVGSGIAYPLSYLLEHLVSLCSHKIKVQVDPSKVRAIDNPFIKCDYSKLADATGWAPLIPIESTLSDMFYYWLQCDSLVD